MKLIVGLGNPGKEHECSRHNAGFLTVDAIAKREGIPWTEDNKRHALTARVIMNNATAILAKPTTFMNLSGEAVQALVSYYKLKSADILIIQDEMDLLPGEMRFSLNGSAAGHHGVESIYKLLGPSHTDLSRLRVGIGHPKEPISIEDWVLGKMNDATLEITQRAANAIVDWITNGLEKTRNDWNGEK